MKRALVVFLIFASQAHAAQTEVRLQYVVPRGEISQAPVAAVLTVHGELAESLDRLFRARPEHFTMQPVCLGSGTGGRPSCEIELCLDGQVDWFRWRESPARCRRDRSYSSSPSEETYIAEGYQTDYRLTDTDLRLTVNGPVAKKKLIEFWNLQPEHEREFSKDFPGGRCSAQEAGPRGIISRRCTLYLPFAHP